MFSQTERMLLKQLISDRTAALESGGPQPATGAQLRLLRELRIKVECAGEFLTVPEIRLALDAAGEADSHRRCWVLYDADIPILTDTLNAIHIRHTIAKKDFANAPECRPGAYHRSRYI